VVAAQYIKKSLKWFRHKKKQFDTYWKYQTL